MKTCSVRHAVKLSVAALVAVLPLSPSQAGAVSDYAEFPYPATAYTEPYRGQFHFSSRWGWMNDVNAPLYYNGTYHLFYQHNPHGLTWDTMHWGHATSIGRIGALLRAAGASTLLRPPHPEQAKTSSAFRAAQQPRPIHSRRALLPRLLHRRSQGRALLLLPRLRPRLRELLTRAVHGPGVPHRGALPRDGT